MQVRLELRCRRDHDRGVDSSLSLDLRHMSTLFAHVSIMQDRLSIMII